MIPFKSLTVTLFVFCLALMCLISRPSAKDSVKLRKIMGMICEWFLKSQFNNWISLFHWYQFNWITEDNIVDHTNHTTHNQNKTSEKKKFWCGGWRKKEWCQPHLLVDCSASGGDWSQGGKVLIGQEFPEKVSLWPTES